MGIPIAITPTELRRLQKALRTNTEIVCLDHAAYVKTLLVARDLLMNGEEKVAKVREPKRG
jgi:hypothetical protein